MWGAKCCATGLDIESLLVASHIHPWSASDDQERLDPYNGLLLSAALDAAFDRGLITLSPEGSWDVVSNLTEAQLTQAGLDKLQQQKVRGLTDRHEVYLSRHRRLAQEQAAARSPNMSS
ncbi:HNH endonuclease signature motif containing protein [Rhizobium sp. BK538]|uniref:HNH endonuclease signature motif containing protein n=1 Tax=Rhizobium sp. BK538 TaxID=2586984 RepID=UPI00161DF70A|nr:HNH endonuclease signature motif containing protein [Rhizobium sp. BK538]